MTRFAGVPTRNEPINAKHHVVERAAQLITALPARDVRDVNYD